MPDLAPLPQLAALRDSHVLAFSGRIDHEAPPIFYEHLRATGRVPRLDLVLATNGGTATAARRLALLLHEYTDRLTVLVAHRARSAGTLLCLGAHQLVLGPLAELGPLDPQIAAAPGAKPGEPGVLSAEEVRAFRLMAEDWFGVARDEDRLQVLALLAQRVFPGTLGAFYRADRLIRQMAGELLHHQLPEAEQATRDAIVDQLVGGYHGHDYAITREQAGRLGLRVSHPDPAEEALMWGVVRGVREQAADANGHRVLAVVAGPEFRARRVEYPAGPDGGRDVHWEVG